MTHFVFSLIHLPESTARRRAIAIYGQSGIRLQKSPLRPFPASGQSLRETGTLNFGKSLYRVFCLKQPEIAFPHKELARIARSFDECS
jgi:hypothetical protein